MGNCSWGSSGGGVSGTQTSFSIPAENFVGQPDGQDNPPQMRDYLSPLNDINYRAFAMPVDTLGGSWIQATHPMPIELDINSNIDIRLFWGIAGETQPFPRNVNWDLNLNAYKNDEPFDLAVASTVSFEDAAQANDHLYITEWQTLTPVVWTSFTQDMLLLFNIYRGTPVANDATVSIDFISMQCRYSRA